LGERRGAPRHPSGWHLDHGDVPEWQDPYRPYGAQTLGQTSQESTHPGCTGRLALERKDLLVGLGQSGR